MLSERLKSLFIPQEIPRLGSDTPELYLLVDVPNFINTKEESPLFRDSYVVLIEALLKNKVYTTEKEILESICISSSLKYCPKDPVSIYKVRKHTSIDLKNLSHLNYKEIKDLKPKVIVASGSDAIKIITDFEYSTYEEVEKLNDYKYNQIPVVFLPSINDAVSTKNGSFLRKEFDSISGVILKARNLSRGIESKGPLEDLKWTYIDAFNPKEVETLFNLFIENSKIVLDYEASGLNTYREGFHLGGIGLCSLDCKTSVYVHFYDFFRRYNGTNPVPQQTLDILNSFFKIKDFVVFNKNYECSVTISQSVGINVNLKKCEDLLMWLRCLSSSSSLKVACVNKLGISKWNDDVEDWVDCINTIIKLEKPTESMKGQRKEIEWMRKNCEGFFDIKTFFESEYYNELIKELKRIAKGKPKILKELKISSKLKNPIIEYAEKNKKRLNSSKEKAGIIEELTLLPIFANVLPYSKYKDFFLKKKDINFLEKINQLEKICKEKLSKFEEANILLKDYIFNLLENHKIFEYASYADIPIELISPYCIADCNYTAKLYHKLKGELEEKGLVEAAKVYDKQAYLGHVLSRNGIAWDDDLATELEKEYSEVRIEALRSLITLPSMIKVLKLNTSRLLNVRATTDIDYLKEIFNPNSSYNYENEKEELKTTYRMGKVIGTPRFKLACMLYDSFEYLKQTDNEKQTIEQFPTFYKFYKQIIELKSSGERLEFLENILKNPEELNRVFYDNLNKYREKQEKLNANKNKYKREQTVSYIPLEAFNYGKVYKSWKLESLDRTATERLFNVFTNIIGIDTLNDYSWPEEFLALYYFKIFKKVEKSIGTYLNGNIGRSLVEIVRKDDLEEKAPSRLCGYLDRPKTENEVYINKTNWGVCTATTKRWQAAQHTVPKSTELMDLRTTRYGDEGIKLHYDYCLHKDTLIVLGNGKSKSIIELFNDFNNNILNTVVSKNLNEKSLEEKEVINVIETKYQKTLIELEFEEGLVIKCTPDHKFILKNGEYKEAKDLTVKDEIDEFSSKIECNVCKKEYAEISYAHLNTHEVKYLDYKDNNKVTSEFSSYLRSKKLKNKKLPKFHVERIKEGANNRWESEEEREKQSERGRIRYFSLESRLDQAEKTKKQWKNPEIKKKMIQSICDSRGSQERVYTRGKSGYLVTKKGGKIFYRSSYERQYVLLLEKDPKVKSFRFEPFVIKINTIEGVVRNYLPDVLVYYHDNTRELIEIKAEWERDKFLNSYKYKGALAYCNKLDIKFSLKTEKDIFINEA